MLVEQEADAAIRAQLNALAFSLVLGPLANPDLAIRLACELITRGLDTPATVDVAALSYGTPLRDSEPQIREMLAEQHAPVPDAPASDSEYLSLILRAFASGCMPIEDFFVQFYRAAPAWSEQTESERALHRLLADLDDETSPADKAELIAAMRKIAGGHAKNPA